MLTLARLPTATAASGVRAERASLKTVCRATGGGRRNNSRSPKTKPQNVVPGRASTKASVSSGKNSVDSSVHATAFDAAFGDAQAPVAPVTPADTPAAPRETKVYDDVDSIIEMLPEDVRGILRTHRNRDQLLEVVLDLGRRPEARFAGDIANEFLRDEVISQADLDAAEASVGEFGGDNRAGIEGTLHRISAIRNRRGKIVGLTCRVGRAVTGHVEMIEDMLTGNESILFLGRPGVGKTTVIREIARVLSDELGKRVVIIDTSNEIGGDGDIPHRAIGSARRMQVPDPALQHQIMIEAVENHMPEVIIVDEIGTEEEAIACRTIAERGVQLVGTAHGQLLENLIKNPTLTDLVGGVQSVTLGDDEARARGCQKTIMERQAPPTFPILIEMHERSMWVAHNVEESVDEVLAGGRPMVQVRSRDQNTGRVRFNRTVYDMDVFLSQKNVAYTLGSMGGLMGATADLAEARSFGLAEEGMANNAVANAAGWSPTDYPGTNDSIDDPYAWANNLGMVPDKDALEAMGAHGYVGTGKYGNDKRGNGRQSKRGRQGPRAFR